MKAIIWTSTVFSLAIGACLLADDIKIESLSHNGWLTWTNSSLNVTCRVEWAATADGPWQSSWESLSNIVITNYVTQRSVPMFYRVVGTSPPTPLITNITAAAALTMITHRVGDPNFVILDVRTLSEYATKHLKGALNLDLRSSDFPSRLDALSRSKTYLVYCASGSRSGQAVEMMRALRFLEVYNMGALSSFTALSGATAWLEP